MGAAGATGPSGSAGATGATGPTGPPGVALNPLRLAALQWWPGRTAPYDVNLGTVVKGLAFDGRYMWAACVDGTLKALYAKAGMDKLGTVYQSLSLGGYLEGLVYDGANLWVTDFSGNAVIKIKPDLTTQTFTAGISGGPFRMAFDGQRVWVTNWTGNTVVALNPEDGSVWNSLTGFSEPLGILYDGNGSMWVANHLNDTVTRINVANPTAQTNYKVGAGPRGLAFAGGHVWVACSNNNTLYRIDPDTGAKAVFNTATAPLFIAFDGTYLWITCEDANAVEVRRLDGSLLGLLPNNSGISFPSAIAFDGQRIWTANWFNQVVSIR